MITVVDQHKPWLTPSSTLANTIQPQLGAQMMSSGTGRPASHPATRSGLRPIRSASWPASRFASAFTTPKLMRKERTEVFEARPKSAWAIRGRTVRSSPTIAPTNALTTTSSANWRQLAPSPSRMGGGDVASGNGAAIGARLQLRAADGRQEQRVASEQGTVVQKIGGALRGVAGCVQRPEPGGSHAHDIAVVQWRVLKGDAIRRRKTEPGLGAGRKSPGAGQVVGVHVCFENGADAPAVRVGHALVHLGIERRIDHRGVAARLNEIG